MTDLVARGGYRGGGPPARFTEQLVWLDTPETKKRVRTLAIRYALSQSQVLRAVAGSGLAALEAGLADGTIQPGELV